MDKALEAAARALSERSNFALAGDLDAQVEHDQRMMDNAKAAITAYLAQREADGFVMVPKVSARVKYDYSGGKGAKPDPLAEAWIEATGNTVGMEPLNEALAKRGGKIVWEDD